MRFLHPKLTPHSEKPTLNPLCCPIPKNRTHPVISAPSIPIGYAIFVKRPRHTITHGIPPDYDSDSDRYRFNWLMTSSGTYSPNATQSFMHISWYSAPRKRLQCSEQYSDRLRPPALIPVLTFIRSHLFRCWYLHGQSLSCTQSSDRFTPTYNQLRI